VLLDIMMPKMSGYEVCKRLRERFPPTELPIILLTAKNLVDNLVDGLNVGANDYLSKPTSRLELVSRIRVHLQLAKINIASGRFLPREFLRLLKKENIVDVGLGDHVEGEMTIMFSDIRSFTTLSGTMSPEDNFAFINAYLKRVAPIITAHHGFIDKYIGDAVMALFPTTADDAVQAAVALQRDLVDFNRHRILKNYRPIEVGIGMHIGLLMLGTIGSEERMQGTVISDAVNLASRIEDLTKLFGAQILISQLTLQRLRVAYSSRFLGKTRVKGKEKVVGICEVFTDESRDILKIKTKGDFETGLERYFARSFAEACVYFERVTRINPRDVAASWYLKRSAEYMVQGVPKDWEGNL
jgi:two-component system sensor histidine kinase ChiS